MKKANERTIARGAVAAYNINTHTYMCTYVYIQANKPIYMYECICSSINTHTLTHTESLKKCPQ